MTHGSVARNSPEWNVLQHPTRKAILDLLQHRPGLSFTEIRRAIASATPVATQVSQGALAYHLMALGRHKRLRSIRAGRYRRFYPTGGPWNADLEGCALLQTTPLWNLGHLLVREPGMTLRQIAGQLGPGERHDPSWLRHQLRRLVRHGFARAERRGRVNVYQPQGRLLRVVGALDSFRVPAAFLLMPHPSTVGFAGGLPRPVAPPPGAIPLPAPMAPLVGAQGGTTA